MDSSHLSVDLTTEAVMIPKYKKQYGLVFIKIKGEPMKLQQGQYHYQYLLCYLSIYMAYKPLSLRNIHRDYIVILSFY